MLCQTLLVLQVNWAYGRFDLVQTSSWVEGPDQFLLLGAG